MPVKAIAPAVFAYGFFGYMLYKPQNLFAKPLALSLLPAKHNADGTGHEYSKNAFEHIGHRGTSGERQRRMKLKEFFYWLGIKPKPVEYGIQITDQELPGYGNIQYANWLHPKMRQNNLDINKINVLKRFLSPGDVAIDIGAHVGDTSIEMALAVGRLGTVFAFEPNCHVFRILEKNASLNPDYCNIIPFMFAATDSDAELTFNYSDPGFCNGGEFLDVSNLRHAHLFPLSVSGRNVSSLLLQKYPEAMAKLKYIKIDTEGADYRVFKTLEPLVRNTHPYVRSEINRHMPAQERFEYWKYITSLNYSVVLSDSDDGPSEKILSEENILNPKTFDIWAIPNTKSKSISQ